MTASLLSPAEAARLLGVTARRVYALVETGEVVALRVSGRPLIDRREVDARIARGASAGRPYSPRRAWAIILISAGLDPTGLDAATRSKLRRVVRERDLWSLRSKVTGRCERRALHAHSSDLARIEADPDVVRTGPRAAPDVGLSLVAADAPLEVYVDARTADRLISRYRLASSADPNVVLRIVPDAVRPWLQDPVAPRPAVALDIAEDRDARSQDVAEQALRRP